MNIYGLNEKSIIFSKNIYIFKMNDETIWVLINRCETFLFKYKEKGITYEQIGKIFLN